MNRPDLCENVQNDSCETQLSVGTLLDNVGIVFSDAVGGVVSHGGVLEYAAVPHVSVPELLQFSETSIVDVVHLAHSVLFDRAVHDVRHIAVAEQTNENLIDELLIAARLGRLARTGGFREAFGHCGNYREGEQSEYRPV